MNLGIACIFVYLMSSVALDRIFINLCCVDDSVAWGHFLFNGNFPESSKRSGDGL